MLAVQIRQSELPAIFAVLHREAAAVLGHRAEVRRVGLSETVGFQPIPRRMYTMNHAVLRDAVTTCLMEGGLSGSTEIARDSHFDLYLVVTLQTCAFVVSLS